MIRITIERKHLNSFPSTMVKEFEDEYEAANWFVQDSYFAEGYTLKATWERVPATEPATHAFTNVRGEVLCSGYRPGPDGIFVMCGLRADHPIHTVPAEPAQVTMYYTFGVGTSRKNRYVKITAETPEHCRAIMLNHFGRDWAFDYTSAEKAGVSRFGLTEIPRDEWPPSSCTFEVDESGMVGLKR